MQQGRKRGFWDIEAMCRYRQKTTEHEGTKTPARVFRSDDPRFG